MFPPPPTNGHLKLHTQASSAASALYCRRPRLFSHFCHRDLGVSAVALAALLLLLPPTVLGCAYQVYFHAHWGQTLGKMATRVRVLSVDGCRIGLRQALRAQRLDILLAGFFIAAQASALLRIPSAEYASLGWLEQSRRLSELMGQWQWLSWVQAAWMISEVVTMLFNPRRRALHDLDSWHYRCSRRFRVRCAARRGCLTTLQRTRYARR